MNSRVTNEKLLILRLVALGNQKGREAMEKVTVIGWDELWQMMKTASQVYDIARLVDPVNMKVISIGKDGKCLQEAEHCYRIWRRDSKCSNCSSLRAYEKEWAVSKNEKLDNNEYHVFSNVVSVMDSDNQERKLVLELASQTNIA